MKIRIIILGLTLAFAGTQAAFSAELKLTVDEAARIAMDNNLGLRRAALNTDTLRRASNRAWNGLSPTLTAGAMVSHPTSITGAVPPPQDVWTPGFTMSAGLTLSAATIENIRRAQADYAAGLLSYEAARQELELNVRRLFYQILLLDANRELAARNLESAQARYQQSATLASVGQLSLLDELMARVDMENLRPMLKHAEILYENALDTLKLILGLPEETVIRLDGNLSREIAVPESALDFASMRAQPQESLETAILRESIRSMEAQRNTVRNSAYIPSLRLAWNSTPLFVDTPLGRSWNDVNGSFSVTLAMSLDSFFPWSAATTQMQALNDAITSTQLQLSDSLRNRDNRLTQSIRTIERILESREAMLLNVELAQTSYEMFTDAFTRGVVDYQSLLSARNGLEQAENRLLQEQFNLVSAILDLERELNIPFGTLHYFRGE